MNEKNITSQLIDLDDKLVETNLKITQASLIYERFINELKLNDRELTDLDLMTFREQHSSHVQIARVISDLLFDDETKSEELRTELEKLEKMLSEQKEPEKKSA